jgi:hypothetical protein
MFRKKRSGIFIGRMAPDFLSATSTVQYIDIWGTAVLLTALLSAISAGGICYGRARQ